MTLQQSATFKPLMGQLIMFPQITGRASNDDIVDIVRTATGKRGAVIFSLSFDDQSMKEIAQFAGFAALLSDEVQQAESQVADLLIQKIHDNGLARFAQNSPGGLAESFVATNTSKYEIEVGSDKPYAHRLDAGFDGADSLGRVYHQQPTWYATDALAEVESDGSGMEILQDGVQAALEKTGVQF